MMRVRFFRLETIDSSFSWVITLILKVQGMVLFSGEVDRHSNYSSPNLKKKLYAAFELTQKHAEQRSFKN